MLDIEKIENKSISKVFGTFYLDNNEVAIEVSYIREVVDFPTKLMKMPLSPEYLLGVFNLRGNIISVVSLHKLLNFNYPEKFEDMKIAIISNNGEFIGITCDSTGEIIRIKNDEKKHFKYPEKSTIKIINSAIKLNNGERIIQVLNPFDLLHYENIPRVKDDNNTSLIKEEAQNSVKKIDNYMKKCISFFVGNSRLAFEIVKIDEVVKFTEIEKTSAVDETCVGTITLREQKIPIVNFSEFLGIKNNKTTKLDHKTIIIMKTNNNKFGLLIDDLESIISYWSENLTPIISFTKRKLDPFKGCIIRKDEDDLILLDQEKIFSDDEIKKITEGYSSLYNKRSNDLKEMKKGKIILFITFKLTHLFAINIKDVREIINYNSHIITPPGSSSFMQGILNLRGEVISIINTRELYGLNSEHNELLETKKIIIIQKNNLKVGLLVDEIENIIHVDENDKTLLPNYILKSSNEKFHDDVKEIIGISKESTDSIIILDIDSLSKRLLAENIVVSENSINDKKIS